MCASIRVINPQCAMQVKAAWQLRWEAALAACRTIDRSCVFDKRFEFEHTCWDPKDGELCLSRAKPGETLVEARSDSDVQIDRQTWV